MSDDACLTYTLVAVLLIGGLGAAFYLVLHLSPLLAYLLAVNVGVLLLYRYDKYASLRKGAQRIPNEMMGLLALLGPLGAGLGMVLEVFPGDSHKTAPKWWCLHLIVIVSSVLHLVLLGAYVLVGGEAMLDWARGLLAGL